MKRLDSIALGASVAATFLTGCGDNRDDGGGITGATSVSGSATAVTATATDSNSTGDTAGTDDDSDTGTKFDTTVDGGVAGCGNIDVGCTDQIDILFVIDNSGTMGEEQLNLAKNFPLLIKRLEELKDKDGKMVNPDVQIMVTTTDFGNPLCDPFKKHEPEKGAPIATGCNSRIDRFTGLTTPPVVVKNACTDVCPVDIAPEDNFIHFWGKGQAENNVPDAPPADVNGDGIDDSEVAQALACIGPQGIDGCGYEAPLENMLQALNPGSPWNTGAKPFLRSGALLAVVVVTDEVDCSVKDYSIMTNPGYQEVDPDKGTKTSSSAVCWNAGVSCNGPDANGVYTGCVSTTDEKLQPTSRYINYLVGQLRDKQGKEVVMLGILGVPIVTEHNPNPPFEPTAGGVTDLVYRDWKDPQYPTGDILPAEWANGITAAHKQFDFGIGPGCTGEDGMGGFTGQAIPPVRVKEVCEALNIHKMDGTTDVRCCIESICDTDFSAAIDCLTGVIQESIKAPG